MGRLAKKLIKASGKTSFSFISTAEPTGNFKNGLDEKLKEKAQIIC